MSWIVLLLMILASIQDLRRREIPDSIPIAVALITVLAAVSGVAQVTWIGIAAGFAIALAIGLPLFACGGVGGGDIKLVAALGAYLGPQAFLHTMFWVAVCGGLLAAVAACQRRRDFAYGPAIAVGFMVYFVQLEVLSYAQTL